MRPAFSVNLGCSTSMTSGGGKIHSQPGTNPLRLPILVLIPDVPNPPHKGLAKAVATPFKTFSHTLQHYFQGVPEKVFLQQVSCMVTARCFSPLMPNTLTRSPRQRLPKRPFRTCPSTPCQHEERFFCHLFLFQTQEKHERERERKRERKRERESKGKGRGRGRGRGRVRDRAGGGVGGE